MSGGREMPTALPPSNPAKLSNLGNRQTREMMPRRQVHGLTAPRAATQISCAHPKPHVAFAIEFFQRVQARTAEAGDVAPLGAHLLMGTDAPHKLANVTSTLNQGLIAPIKLICRVR